MTIEDPEVIKHLRKTNQIREPYRNEETLKTLFLQYAMSLLKELKEQKVVDCEGPSDLQFDTFNSITEYKNSDAGTAVGCVKEEDEYSAHICYKIPSEVADVHIFIRPEFERYFARVQKGGERELIEVDSEGTVISRETATIIHRSSSRPVSERDEVQCPRCHEDQSTGFNQGCN